MKKLKDIVIYEDEGYNAFPSFTRGIDGIYYLVFRHAPDRRAQNEQIHVDPESKIYLMTSTDGFDWSKPKTILNKQGCDETGPCIHALMDGSILVTTYTWKIEPASKKPMLEKVVRPCVFEGFYPENRIAYLDGLYAMLSNDGGENFKHPFLIEKNCALQGKIVQLPDKTILAPLCNYGSEPGHDGNAVIYASADMGIHWEPYSFICGPINNYSPEEVGLFMAKSGRLYCFIRTPENMWYCFSDDNGHSWVEPIDSKIPANVPFNALQLPDGRVFLSYGRRIEPYGIRALILDSELNGISSEREIILRDDGGGWDSSYNWAELLPNGDILVVYYFYNDNVYEGRRHIAGTIVRP